MKIFDVPIEPFEERYSIQWWKWFDKAWSGNPEVQWMRVVPGDVLTEGITTGEFLDVYGTNWFKAQQIAILMELLFDGEIKDGDWIFFHDLWFPGIEALAYVRDATKIQFKIAGCLHAGTWDHWDFIYQKGMHDWAGPFERSMLNIADLVFVATYFHKSLITKEHHIHCGLAALDMKIRVTGFPIYPKDFVNDHVTRDENLVVFPHRLAPEKDPDMFEVLKDAFKGTDLRFVYTKKECQNKKEYYELLARAGIAVSFAHQETWGICMQEVLFSNTIVFVPDRLSYSEMYHDKLKFTSMSELGLKIREAAAKPEQFDHACEWTRQRLEKAGYDAIHNMHLMMAAHGIDDDH